MMANIWWSLPLTLIVFFAARKLAARYKFPGDAANLLI